MCASKLKSKVIGICSAKGMKHTYNSVSEEKLAKMMEVNYQERTEIKMRWAVKLYKDWCNMRLDRVDYEDEIFELDIDNIANVSKDAFEFAMCRFICEVKKVKDQGDYPGCTLYQWCAHCRIILEKKGEIGNLFMVLNFVNWNGY